MKNKKDKLEISLLTLLAHESTSGARKVLQKYGKKDAQNYTDLEKKLAELYFNSPDKKLDIEKDLAEIHPHKKWLEKTLKLVPQQKIEEKKEQVKETEIPKEQNTNTKCTCKHCQHSELLNELKHSSIEGELSELKKDKDSTSNQKEFDKTHLIVVGAISIFAIFALSMHYKK